MYENRTSYPEAKTQMYKLLQEIPKKYKVMALVRMDKVRASQILPLRKKLRGEVEFISIKDKIARKALEKMDIPNIKKTVEQLTGQCMFMFTNMSPFKLNVLLTKNKVMMAARDGDIASVDVVVPAKNTGVAPGPMLTDFKEANIPTKIDQGTIWITKDTTPVRKGEPIGGKLAGLLVKLDIKPIEAGIALESALEDGIQYTREDLAVDVQAIREEFARAHQEAVSLSIEAAYITPENIGPILARASQHARSLAVESAFMTEETREQVLQRADSQARAVASKAKGYTAG